MEFGKSISEVFDEHEEKKFTMVKKFLFWKWRMVYKITDNKQYNSILIAENNRNTIYKLNYNSSTYKVLIHHKKRFSILKNEEKIAEIDNSFTDKDFLNSIKIVTSSTSEFQIIFMLFSCIKIGETDQTKVLLKSQKQLEPNKNPWT